MEEISSVVAVKTYVTSNASRVSFALKTEVTAFSEMLSAVYQITQRDIQVYNSCTQFCQYFSQFSLSLFFFGGVRLSPPGTVANSGLLYKPQMIDEGDCGAIGGIKIGRGNRSTRRKPAPSPLCPPQIPHYQTRARTRATAVRSQRVTA
jgi:hypothetical protein